MFILFPLFRIAGRATNPRVAVSFVKCKRGELVVIVRVGDTRFASAFAKATAGRRRALRESDALTCSHGRDARATTLALHAGGAAFDQRFDFLQRGHAGVAGGGHGEGAVGCAVFDRFLGVVEFHEAVN
jgi:hypothetical protein